VLVYLWEVGARRTAALRDPWRDAFVRESGWLALSAVIAVLVYVASWAGWFASDSGWDRHWLASQGRSEPPVLGALYNLWHYHLAALDFHTHLNSPHDYQSWPWQWLILGRPVAFYYSGNGPCGADSCSSEVLLLGTPALWWAFLPALAALLWLGITRRDWRVWAIMAGVGAGIVPWLPLTDRTMFYFYALPAEPFLVLAVVYVLGAIMSPARRTASDDSRRLIGAIIAGAYLLLVAACFAYFYPVYIGDTIPYAEWSKRMLLDSRWI